jgi:hypothetical protein
MNLLNGETKAFFDELESRGRIQADILGGFLQRLRLGLMRWRHSE